MENKDKITKREIIVLLSVTILIGVVVMVTLQSWVTQQQIIQLKDKLNEVIDALNNASQSGILDGSVQTSYEIHARIRMWKNGNLIFDQYHAGAVTTLGLNTTLAKLTGDNTFYNQTTFNLNCTYISIGNKGTLTTASTVLPGEWNRTTATVEDEAYNSFNLTATFYPDSGPYTADCIGVNYEAGIGKDMNLFCYDTFSEETSIDDTYTINVEFQISVS